MSKLILLNKPYGVICQFSPSPPHQCLADYVPVKDVYPAGRLDTDSEGLLLLTDDGRLQHRITDPGAQKWKTYWAQVEGAPDEAACSLCAWAWIWATLSRGPRLSASWMNRRACGHAIRPSGSVPISPRTGWRSAFMKAKKPSGASYDGQGRVPDAALDPRCDWRLDTG